jgi:hypothetical protein
LNPLLSWRGPDGDLLELSGVTFATTRVNSLEDAQWFSRLVLLVNNVTLLNVSRGEAGFGEMEVDVRGQRIRGTEGELSTEVSTDGLVQASLSLRKHVRAWTHRKGTGVSIGHKYGQLLSVDAPAFRFSIESKPASARKYADAAGQILHGHLNLRFEQAELPASASGLIAKLASASSVSSSASSASKRLVTKVTDLLRRREERRATRASEKHYQRSTLAHNQPRMAAGKAAAENEAAKKEVADKEAARSEALAREAAEGVSALVAALPANTAAAEDRAMRFAAMRMRPRSELSSVQPEELAAGKWGWATPEAKLASKRKAAERKAAELALVAPVAKKRAAKTRLVAQRATAKLAAERASTRLAERAAHRRQTHVWLGNSRWATAAGLQPEMAGVRISR